MDLGTVIGIVVAVAGILVGQAIEGVEVALAAAGDELALVDTHVGPEDRQAHSSRGLATEVWKGASILLRGRRPDII